MLQLRHLGRHIGGSPWRVRAGVSAHQHGVEGTTMSNTNHFDRITVASGGVDRRTFIRSATGALLAVTAFGAAACANESGGGGGAKTEAVDFQIRWLKTVAFAGWWAGIENGYFKDEGIDLNVIAGGPNLDVQQVVAGGGVPIGEGITDRIIRGKIEQDLPFRIIGCLYQKTPAVFMSLGKNNWTKPADLVGKRIGTTSEGVPLIEALLAKAGLPRKDWEFVQSGFDPSPLVQGEIDFFQGFRTDQGVALELQDMEMNYITYDQFGFDPYDAPIFVLEETLENDRDLLVRFMRASIKGWEWAVANPAKAAELTVEKYGTDELQLEQQKLESKFQVDDVTSADTDEHGLFYTTEQRWQDMIDFLADAGSLPKSIPATDIYTPEIQAEAMDGASSLLDV
jgi:ABC-type nitrate/sulfonate/bicarbonate transport system substrate-binding protein